MTTELIVVLDMNGADAARAGATHVVVGRPILKHGDPAEAVRLIKEELASA